MRRTRYPNFGDLLTVKLNSSLGSLAVVDKRGHHEDRLPRQSRPFARRRLGGDQNSPQFQTGITFGRVGVELS
ncbi:hypothetical protein DF3PB_600008 [uncultured Defluviicoccus sp.]|uniref:Uncharacterized protein n=1 Tax=metagenome TaxID=256318 RepID=A0A380TKM8_9ZZZZ|nr:hypothetical protein DF3PB_600008 [uncultured Defluviicoccus sp.]